MTGFSAAELDLNQLEEIILTKVQQRTPARMNEDTYIVKVFKYHDLGNTGYCDFSSFKKALVPFTSGIDVGDLQVIFNRYTEYDTINYKAFAAEFVSGVRRVPGLLPEPADNAFESVEETLQRIKDFVYSQGPRGIMNLAAQFMEADPTNQRVLSYEVFFQTMTTSFSESDCPISDDQIDQIFQTFRQMYAPNQVAYDEFFLALKEELSPERRASIRAAFRRLDSNYEGLVDTNLMFGAFNASRHPEVSDGTRDADDVLEEFVDTLKDLVAFRRGQRSYPTNLVAWEEFEDYYKFVSACYDTDGFFCDMMQKCWDLDKVPDMGNQVRASVSVPAAGVPPKSRTGLHHWQANTLPASPWLKPPPSDRDAQDKFKFSPPNRPQPVLDLPPKSPMAEPRPPTFDGPSAYHTGPISPRGVPEGGMCHRRFLRKEPQEPLAGPSAVDGDAPQVPPMLSPTTMQFSPITKSSIVFNEEGSKELDVVCQRLRQILARRGLKGWRLLVQAFEKYDHRSNGTVMRTDWERVNKSLGLGLAQEDRELVLKTLSKKRRDGAMDYRALLRHMKAGLKPDRQELIAALHDHIKDPDVDIIPLDDLKVAFNAQNHPACVFASKDVRQTQQDFYDALDFFANPGGLSADEFLDFFAMVSAIHENDDEFRLGCTEAFGLPLH